jgi:undecaprenyl-diphosphatase
MQFSLWQVAVLAVVQGVTEFLPISSDGHLVLVRPLLFPSADAPKEAMDLTIVGEDWRVVPLLAVGTLPAVVVVLVCKSLLGPQFESILQSELLAGLMLPVTGGALRYATACGMRPGSLCSSRSLLL